MAHVAGCRRLFGPWEGEHAASLVFCLCREQLQDLYVRLHDLIEYCDLNKEGFRKALKKHDKVLARVAPKRLDEQRPRWESVLSKKSKEKLEVGLGSPPLFPQTTPQPPHPGFPFTDRPKRSSDGSQSDGTGALSQSHRGPRLGRKQVSHRRIQIVVFAPKP
jgi:hypothetical protein